VPNSLLHRIAYGWQASNIWQGFLLFLTVIAILLTYFEPNNTNDTDFYQRTGYEKVNTMMIEIMIISAFFLDIVLEIFHSAYDIRYHHFNFLYTCPKLYTRILFDILLLADLIYFHTNFPVTALRFGRWCRPGRKYNLVLYNDIYKKLKPFYKKNSETSFLL
jgi:magnesium-transporting ATPase (P-type)